MDLVGVVSTAMMTLLSAKICSDWSRQLRASAEMMTLLLKTLSCFCAPNSIWSEWKRQRSQRSVVVSMALTNVVVEFRVKLAEKRSLLMMLKLPLVAVVWISFLTEQHS